MNTQQHSSSCTTLSAAQAVKNLAKAEPGAIRVEASAKEMGRHFAKLASAVAAGRIEALSITDGQPLPLARADFLAHPSAYASALQAMVHRPVRIQFS